MAWNNVIQNGKWRRVVNSTRILLNPEYNKVYNYENMPLGFFAQQN